MDPILNSLLSSFRRVPPAAIPAMLDCILASMSSSPSSLFASLLNEFPNITKDKMVGSNERDAERDYCIVSYVAALCHLLKRSGSITSEIELFVCRILIPLLKLAPSSHLDIFNEVASMFFDAVLEMNSWDAVEATLVPFLFRLIGLSMGMIQSQESAMFEWSSRPILQVSDDHQPRLHCFQQCSDKPTNELNRDLIQSQFDYFPLPISCYILALTLDASLQCKHVVDCTCSLQVFANKLIWDLCNLTFQMLLHSVEHRSFALSILLPSILRVLASHCAFEVSSGVSHILTRKHLLEEIWKCCKKLFSMGLSERRDAYTILSLSLSTGAFNRRTKDGNVIVTRETFDLTVDNDFWDEIKRGLVDKETLTRKQSLHVLKSILNLRAESCQYPGLSHTITDRKSLDLCGMTKRERWAEEEAKSLGVGKLYNLNDHHLDNRQRWEAFILLYEMLEEYGTHLVEAAWHHQMNLLLQSSLSLENSVSSHGGDFRQNWMENLEEIYEWLAVLWERGFCHDNPQVRCLIMQSFLGVPWKDYGSNVRLVPEEFILGPLMQGLNDPVHHQDFGLKRIYSSCTIDAAASFLCQYCFYLDPRKQIKFLIDLASTAKKHSFGRPGLMCLVECIASAARGVEQHNNPRVAGFNDASLNMIQVKSGQGSSWKDDKVDLLDFLRYIIESSKQHFNANYRLQVCERMLDAATSVMAAVDIPLEILLHFISNLPREFTDFGGPLRFKIQKWLIKSDDKHCTASCRIPNLELLTALDGFPKKFTYSYPVEARFTFDDADIDKWEYEAKRWVRVIFLVSKQENLETLFTFLRDHGKNVCKQQNLLEWVPVKYLILVSSLVQELQINQDRTVEGPIRERIKANIHLPGTAAYTDFLVESSFLQKFAKCFLLILEELVSFAKSSCSIFWSNQVEHDCILPSSIRGRLGGPSLRRLSSSIATSVLQAIISLKSVASISRWCAQFTPATSLNSALTFLWSFCWKIITTPSGRSETEAEIRLGSYEALAHILKELVSVFSPLSFDVVVDDGKSCVSEADDRPTLDTLVQTFLQCVNNLIETGNLVRTRRAILINWKWICIECLLLIPKYVLEKGVYLRSCNIFLSDVTANWIFSDLVDSLENAGEVSVLPLLRSVRLIMELFASDRKGLVVTSSDGMNTRMMWDLVKSSWILHVSCNKRRVAPIAALLSSVLHYSVFGDECMHEIDGAPGPFKWFIEKILEEGTKSPRTIRLAALHLTGLLLANPMTIKYYLRELKLLTLYGSVAFDEDFEAELTENQDAKSEVSMLAQSPDPELTEEFINTELYARVSVAVLFYKLADMADMVGFCNGGRNSLAALASGKIFLLELLQSVLNDKDLAKELYKKHSSIHRRKIRAWQMICILSRFVYEDIAEEVMCSLHKALQRNNLPSVRQYQETFAIHIYLKFPSLVGQQLVPQLHNYDVRPQALSSYVFIAANVILHAGEEYQSGHLDELLPPTIPLLTSHHHTLRGFTQLLVYQVLHKLLPGIDAGPSIAMPLEKRCLEDLKSYLTENPDCARLRASMEGYLDAFDPKSSVTPAGIFASRVEEQEFECVPKTLMDQVTRFLNDTRDELRCSMARDAAVIKYEGLPSGDYSNSPKEAKNSNQEQPSFHLQEDVSLDFQKKFTLSDQETQTTAVFSIDNSKSLKLLAAIEKEDELLDQLLHSRNLAMQKLKARRQQFILVASLVDRIPNLAGLARTCEVFRAAGLAIADKNILSDKQFQLISVTAEKWVPIIEVPVSSMKNFLEKKKKEGFAILGLEQTANSKPLDQYAFPKRTVLVLGREKEGIPAEIIHVLDACIEIPQMGVIRSLNVHVSGAIALWEYTRQQRSH
ncbi:uncharacterized protein LOC113781357 [Coffea eugenioides]|uniref:uncharacterized protein LOC113781357 n=1 Tax=Coffea eugenioides TaxID=49369 RepID=UPI000F60D3CF|nr:uncharacterized protein LOC113781357 [Coffea eugenioides]